MSPSIAQRHVFICITPLQVLIAQRIIADLIAQPAQIIGLYLPYADTAKHRHYFAKLQAVCDQAAFVVLKNQTWQQRFVTLHQLKHTLKRLNLWQQPVERVYLASVDVLFLQYVIAKINFHQLYTFDDGTANIFPNSSYHQPLPKSRAMQAFKKLLGVRYADVGAVLAASQAHYTIFPHEKNVIANTIPIALYKDLPSPLVHNQPIDKTDKADQTVKRLLLGQGLDAFIGAAAYRELVQTMVTRFAIDAFVPHPRERLDFGALLPVLATDNIIEDYVMAELHQYPNQVIEIYTFMSTAVFTLKDLPRTRITLVYNRALWQQFVEAYQFLVSRGFRLVDIDAPNREDSV